MMIEEQEKCCEAEEGKRDGKNKREEELPCDLGREEEKMRKGSGVNKVAPLANLYLNKVLISYLKLPLIISNVPLFNNNYLFTYIYPQLPLFTTIYL